MPDVPHRLVEEIKANPPVRGKLGPEQTIEGLRSGRLDEVARAYADTAAYHGSRGGYWPIWLEVQRQRGLTVVEAVEDLPPSARQWFARWAFEDGRAGDGAVAYRRYLEEPDQRSPFERDTTAYLDYLLSRQEYHEVVRLVERWVSEHGERPWEETRWAQAEFALGDAACATSRLETLLKRHDQDGELRAQAALVYKRLGDEKRAEPLLEEALQLGVHYRALVKTLCHTFPLMPEQERKLRKEDRPQPVSFEDMARHWWADPGAVVKSSSEPTSHWFGGDDFTMPACRGCGTPIRQWFLLDIRKIEPLSNRLPSWTIFPLLSCPDCMVWMGRHDYQVDLDSREIRLVDVVLANLKDFSDVHGDPFPPLTRQPARLEWLQPNSFPRDDPTKGYCGPQTLVAGVPGWYQEPLTIRCRSCDREMVFVASLASTDEFGCYAPLNSEPGFLYHFACDGCRTISVVAQWS